MSLYIRRYFHIYIMIFGQLRTMITKLDNRLDMGRIGSIKKLAITRLFYGLSYSANGDEEEWCEFAAERVRKELAGRICQVWPCCLGASLTSN